MPSAKMPKKKKFSKMLQFTCFIEGNFSKFGMCKMFDKYDVCPQFFYGKRNILLKSIAVITGYSLIVIKDMWIIWCWQFRLKLWEVNFIFQTDNYWSWPDFPFFRYVNKIAWVRMWCCPTSVSPWWRPERPSRPPGSARQEARIGQGVNRLVSRSQSRPRGYTL